MISELPPKEWDNKTIELGGSILQSWAWGMFQEALGRKIFRLSGDGYQALAVRMELPFNKAYLYCPRGPLGQAADALGDFRKLASDRSVVFARLEPQSALDLPKAVKETQPMQSWMLDLNSVPEELLVRMKPKTRYNINLAQRRGVVVRTGVKADLLPLYKLFLETAARNGFSLHPQNYYWQMFETLSPDFLRLLVAEYKGRVLAGMILTVFGDTATYLHGGSSGQMREVMAPYLLHWEAIRTAKNLGCGLYDFGGVTADAKNNPAWAGLTRFKKGFGGFEVSYPGSFDLIFSPVWYNVYKNVRKLKTILKNHHAV